MLVLEDDVNLSGVSSDSYVVGTVRKKGNDSFVFPIGNDTIYAPIAISAPAVTTDIFTASYFHANPNPLYSISSLGIGIDHVSSNEYWILDRTSGLSNVAVTLTWNEYSGISDLADLRVARWDGSEWSDEGNSGTSGTTVSGSIISNTVTSFSPFTLGSFTSGNPLPVEYFDMSAVSSDDGILIDWSTASETNNDYFVVEKSLDSHVWSEIAFVRGAGNSNMIENYNALDVNPVKGLQYYRIAQNDFNGQISYSKTLSVIWEEAVDVSLYPNPATNAMIINFASSDNAVVTVQIMNTLGKTVKTIQQVGNMSSIDISDLSPGVYYMDFPGSNNLKKCRFIKK
jgi:hypothetical protein